MNYNRAVMKQEVKQAMRQTRPNPMLVTLLYLVIVSVGTGLISWLVNTLFPGGVFSLDDLLAGLMMYGEDYLEDLLYYYSPEYFIQMMIQAGTITFLVSILTTVWTGLMSVGYSGYCLDMVRNMNPQLERVFGGFACAGSVILAYVLVAVFTFLWSLLFGVGFMIVIFGLAFLAATIDSFGLFILLIMVASIGYAVAVVWVVLRYVMVPFAIIDSQNPMSAMDAIRTSKTIMKGRKGSYFVLHLSFIGWYLLEGLIVSVALIIGLISVGGSVYMSGLTPYGTPAVAGSALVLIVLVAVAGIAVAIINLWLFPYITGCDARFYVYATGGGQPIQPYGGQSGPYGGQPGPYGGQSSPYGGQSGPYGGQSGPYGGQSGPYGSQPGPYGGQSGPYGGQPGPYNNNPYGYTPPAQGSFGGYTQAQQPPQYGTGTYSQWGTPQAPQAPSSAATELLAPPNPPAAPEVPTVPGTPMFPDASGATELLSESDSALYEAPYAESEEPGDGASQRPDGPSYPQY